MKKRILRLLLALTLALSLLAGCSGQQKTDAPAAKSGEDGRIPITMYMWDRSMFKELSP